MATRLFAILTMLVLFPATVFADSLYTEGKGSKAARYPTSTSVDSNTNALDVNVTQTVSTATPTGASCKTVTVNSQGVAGASVTVDATVGGVTVMAASTTRCGAVLKNSGTAAMNCSPTGQTPTSTVGFTLNAGDSLVLGLEGQQAQKCIRTTGSSTTAIVIEATP